MLEMILTLNEYNTMKHGIVIDDILNLLDLKHCFNKHIGHLTEIEIFKLKIALALIEDKPFMILDITSEQLNIDNK